MTRPEGQPEDSIDSRLEALKRRALEERQGPEPRTVLGLHLRWRRRPAETRPVDRTPPLTPGQDLMAKAAGELGAAGVPLDAAAALADAERAAALDKLRNHPTKKTQ